MKKLFLLILFAVCITTGFTQNALTLAGGGTTGTVASFNNFNLNLALTPPTACAVSAVRVVLRYTTSNPANNSGDLELTGSGNYNGTQLFNVPAVFNPSSVSSNQIASVPGTTNVGLTLRTTPGEFCNGTVLRVWARISYLNSTGPCTVVNTNVVQMTITAANAWSIQHEDVTPSNELCLGRRAQYLVTVDHPQNQVGVYNLSNAAITFTAPTGAEIEQVEDIFGNVLISGNTTASVTFPNPGLTLIPQLGANVNERQYNVWVLYRCDRFQLNTDITTTATLNGTNPCGAIESPTGNTTIQLTTSCCGGTCGQFVNAEAYCSPYQGPTVKFCIKNNSSFPTKRFNIILPPGVTPTYVQGPVGSSYDGTVGNDMRFRTNTLIQPGETRCEFQLAFNKAVPGDEICLGLKLYTDTTGGAQLDSCDGEKYCFILPDCRDGCGNFVNPVLECVLVNGKPSYVFRFAVSNTGLPLLQQVVLEQWPGFGTPTPVQTYPIIPAVPQGNTTQVLTYNLPNTGGYIGTACFRITLQQLTDPQQSCIGDTVCAEPTPCGGRRAPENSRPETVTGQPAFKVFPNPAKEVLNIQSPGAAENIRLISIVNDKGAAVLNMRVNNVPNTTISLAGMRAGVYLVTINQRYHYKIIKE